MGPDEKHTFETGVPDDTEYEHRTSKIWEAINDLRMNQIKLTESTRAYMETATKGLERLENDMREIGTQLQTFYKDFQASQLDYVQLKTKFADKNYVWVTIASLIIAGAAMIVAIFAK